MEEKIITLLLRCNKEDGRTFFIENTSAQDLDFPIPDQPMDFGQMINYLRSYHYYMLATVLVRSEPDCDIYSGTFQRRFR